jgi:hypothetical protein
MKLNLKKLCVIDDKNGNPQGFGPGEVEVTQAEEKALRERFPKAIIGPKSVVNEIKKEGEG